MSLETFFFNSPRIFSKIPPPSSPCRTVFKHLGTCLGHGVVFRRSSQPGNELHTWPVRRLQWQRPGLGAPHARLIGGTNFSPSRWYKIWDLLRRNRGHFPKRNARKCMWRAIKKKLLTPQKPFNGAGRYCGCWRGPLTLLDFVSLGLATCEAIRPWPRGSQHNLIAQDWLRTSRRESALECKEHPCMVVTSKIQGPPTDPNRSGTALKISEWEYIRGPQRLPTLTLKCSFLFLPCQIRGGLLLGGGGQFAWWEGSRENRRGQGEQALEYSPIQNT